MAQATVVDQTVIKFTQVLITAWIVIAGALQAPGLIVVLAVALSASAAVPSRSLFRLLYQRVAIPLGIAHPNVIPDDPAPHRFAQGLGAIFLGLSSLALLVLDADVLGWGLAGLVVVLAAINLFFDFCAGCFVYYQLTRLGLLRRSRSVS